MCKKNKHAVALGRLGGAAGTGAAKIRRRTKAQSRQMALKGWETRRLNQMDREMRSAGLLVPALLDSDFRGSRGKDLSISTKYLDEARANVDRFLNK